MSVYIKWQKTVYLNLILDVNSVSCVSRIYIWDFIHSKGGGIVWVGSIISVRKLWCLFCNNFVMYKYILYQPLHKIFWDTPAYIWDFLHSAQLAIVGGGHNFGQKILTPFALTLLCMICWSCDLVIIWCADHLLRKMGRRVNPCLLLHVTGVATAMRFQVTQCLQSSNIFWKFIYDQELFFDWLYFITFWELVVLPSISFRYSQKFSHNSRLTRLTLLYPFLTALFLST